MDQHKTVVVTGASDGIGAAAAARLSAQGHRVLVVGRNPQKTARVAERIRAAGSFVADFSRLDEVERLAAELLESSDRIDVLANNAGGLFGKDRGTTEDGHEKTNQVNFLAPFLLTHLLLPRLLESRATVVNTASVAHRMATLSPQDPDLDSVHGYRAMTAYGNSKLADLLFARELDRRHREDGLSTASFHPGVIGSNFSQDSSSPASLLYRTPVKRFMPDSDTGADTLVWLAESEAGQDFGSGTYFARRRPAATSSRAQDSLLALRVWEAAEAALADRLPDRPR